MKILTPETALSSYLDYYEAQKREEAEEVLAERELAQRELLDFTVYMAPFKYHVGWFHEELTETLMAFMRAVEQRKAPRLIVEVPPRHGKSFIASECFPPFLLGHHPEWEVVMASYNQTIADKFGKRVRTRINSSKYQELFPGTKIDPRSNSASFIETLQMGYYLATGIGGMLTGSGAHVIIVDDPVKDRQDAESELMRESTWDWFSSTAITRLHPGGGVLIIQTRWHEDDLAGRVKYYSEENPEADRYHVISYPAIATDDETHRKKGEALHPERFSLTELKKKRATMIPRDWSALYQQNPTPTDGDLFKAKDIHYYNIRDRPDNLYWYLVVDPAVSKASHADPALVWPFGVDSNNTMWFDYDIIHGRIGADALPTVILDAAERHNVLAIIFEGGQIYRSLEPVIKTMMNERNRFFQIIDLKNPTQDKVLRSASARARMAQGKIRVPNCPQMREKGTPELLKFPNGRHDEFVDCLGHGCNSLESQILPSPAKSSPRQRRPEEHLYETLQGAREGWSIDDVRERHDLGHPVKPNPHSPPRLLGGQRRRGTTYRYA